MSLCPHPMVPIPAETIHVARAAFPKGNPYLTMRDELGTLFQDMDFAALYADEGQPGLAPWRLALVTILQFRATLPDRQAAEAVRARIDWKYLLGLELTDPGFDFSVLSEFRHRLLAGEAQELLLDQMLDQCRALGVLKARGQQRTDSTHVLAAIRVLNRLELVGETLRATLNALATVAPAWLQGIVPREWYDRYSRRIEDIRLPRDKAEREVYAQTVGEDGFWLLDALEAPEVPEAVQTLAMTAILRQTWQRHYDRTEDAPSAEGAAPVRHVRFKSNRELPPAAEGIESPYEVDARYRHKRDTQWSGYMVHVSETCEPNAPHLITHVETTRASVHEAMCTDDIHEALVEKELAPDDHLVDAAYISAELLVQSREDHGIALRGPARPTQGWQTQVEGGYTLDQFTIDWEQQTVRCPQGQVSTKWSAQVDHKIDRAGIIVAFRKQDCEACVARELCTRATHTGRRLHLPPQVNYEALQTARVWYESEAGKRQYARRAGIEGTISQGVRAFGMRRTRYRGLDKTHLQHVAIGAAINVDRLVAWFDGRPRAQTRLSRFAALAPTPTPAPS